MFSEVEGDGGWWDVCRMDKRAGYACPRRWIESSSCVIEGRERRHGLTASSKTEERFVRLRISDLLSRIGLRSVLRRLHARALMDRVSSSIKASRGGTRSGKCVSSSSRFSGCERISISGMSRTAAVFKDIPSTAR